VTCAAAASYAFITMVRLLAVADVLGTSKRQAAVPAVQHPASKSTSGTASPEQVHAAAPKLPADQGAATLRTMEGDSGAAVRSTSTPRKPAMRAQPSAGSPASTPSPNRFQAFVEQHGVMVLLVVAMLALGGLAVYVCILITRWSAKHATDSQAAAAQRAETAAAIAQLQHSTATVQSQQAALLKATAGAQVMLHNMQGASVPHDRNSFVPGVELPAAAAEAPTTATHAKGSQEAAAQRSLQEERALESRVGITEGTAPSTPTVTHPPVTSRRSGAASMADKMVQAAMQKRLAAAERRTAAAAARSGPPTQSQGEGTQREDAPQRHEAEAYSNPVASSVHNGMAHKPATPKAIARVPAEEAPRSVKDTGVSENQQQARAAASSIAALLAEEA